MTDRRTNAAGEEITYRYYRCRGRHGGWGKCSAPVRVRADELDAFVDATFRDKFLNPCCDPIAEPSAATDELIKAESDLAAANAELNAFVENASALDVDLFAKGMNARQARRNAAREAVADARNVINGIALPVGLTEVWESLSVAEKRAFLGDAIEVVAVGKGRGPVADRVRVWTVNDPSVPIGLPEPRSFDGLVTLDVAAA
jgi:hypothetical protein